MLNRCIFYSFSNTFRNSTKLLCHGDLPKKSAALSFDVKSNWQKMRAVWHFKHCYFKR